MSSITDLFDSEFKNQFESKIYDGRIHLLRNTYNRIKSNKKLLLQCQQIPFITQIITLSNLLHPLSDDERMKVIDIILESGIYDRVNEIESKNEENFDYIDQLVKELLKWFKEDFFTWVNKLPCSKCDNKEDDKIQLIGISKGYKPEHFAGKASRIERYKCLKCGNIYEFPRYNDIKTLLDTRKGRCGEWNNCFIAILRSLDINVRYIWNAEDHVWCEYYSDKQSRWIHLDSCENSYDQPLLYNSGWGKKMSYVFAIHQYYIVDVTNKYLDPNKPELKLPKDKAPAKYLEYILSFTNCEKLLSITTEDFLIVTSQLIADYHNSPPNKTKMNKEDNSVSNLLARQSGSIEWTSQRGEAGEK